MRTMTDHLTAQETAERLGYTVQHVRRLLRQGEIEGTKIGRDWIVSKEGVSEFATKQANLDLPLDG